MNTAGAFHCQRIVLIELSRVYAHGRCLFNTLVGFTCSELRDSGNVWKSHWTGKFPFGQQQSNILQENIIYNIFYILYECKLCVYYNKPFVNLRISETRHSDHLCVPTSQGRGHSKSSNPLYTREELSIAV